MPLELSIYRISDGVQKMDFAPLDIEARLQDILAQNIAIADENLMVIGREVCTAYNNRIDILAINRDGYLTALELKRDKTPRDIVAQVLDYGSWVRTLRDDDIARIFTEYQQKYNIGGGEQSIDEAFCKRFEVKEMPDELNAAHELVIVASQLDPSTERIVEYLADEYNVNINAIFFRVFKDSDKEYLSRVWLRDPGTEEILPQKVKAQGDWNGEFYVSYGVLNAEGRTWEEAVKFGFISGGGGSWYTNTLSLLEPGDRVWVNIPGVGYVGVAEVLEPRVVVDEFMVEDEKGNKVPICSLDLAASRMCKEVDNPEKAEYLVRVNWLKTVSENQPIKEKGFFGNQNTVARPRTPKWDHTVERLKKRFGIR